MKANSTYPVAAFLFAIILCAVSCMQEEILEPQQEKAVFTIVGNPVEVHLGITVNDLETGVGTRAEQPTTYETETVEEERHVDDLWIFEYSESTKELICPPTYRTISEQKELTDIKMTLSDNNGDPVTIYVVANSGSGVEENGTITDDVGNEIYPFIIYIPENIQGENYNVGVSDKADNAPIPEGSTSTYALNTEASVTVTLQDGSVIGPYTYTAYPGGNSDTNFNVRRNCVYRVNLIISYPVSLDAVPSANCIVCLSGQNTTFFPYCREETGGGYNFTDYLDAYGDDSKKIDHIGIVWQSKTNTNSSDRNGFLGDNSDDSLVWIDDLGNGEAETEYLRKIHVAVPEGEMGNALVAAYNSDGEIIWSWHIWARTPDTDPTSVGTQLYYTYYWDENGIYGKDSGRPRVAGYTIMNSNLGAMQDEPSGSVYAVGGTSGGGAEGFENARPTFGTLYQWGRKDPFPPITMHISTIQYGGTYATDMCIAEYNVEAVGNYFDNSNNAVSIVGGNTTLALFHSVEGKDRKEFDEMIPLTIQNPTVFYAGTNDVNQISVSYERTNLASNMPEPKDGNWILDDRGDHFNRLWGGLDPEQDMDKITKSYDTGYTCTLGDVSNIPVHLYDDYGEKSIFDPCPYGWRVSPPDLWLGFTSTGLNAGSLDNANYNTDGDLSNYSGMTMYMTAWRTGETSFFPNQGTRSPDGCALRVGQCGNYSNATADANDRVNILHLHNQGTYFNIFEVQYMDFFIKSTANPLRCVRVSSVQQ